jgi:hypothetical protein
LINFQNERRQPLAKAGGLQGQGARGEAAVLATASLGNTGSGVLRLSRRLKRWRIIKSALDNGCFLRFVVRDSKPMIFYKKWRRDSEIAAKVNYNPSP